MVERERGGNAEPFHRHFARTVRERPVLVIEPSKHFPRGVEVSASRSLDPRETTCQYRFAESDRACALLSLAQQRDRLNHDQVRCEQQLAVRREPPLRSAMLT